MNQISSISNGRAIIPAPMRAALDLRDGDQLVWSMEGGQLHAISRRAQLAAVQAEFKKMLEAGQNAPSNAQGQSMADELIAQRRAEQALEDRL
jgi:bifunctional DNA-binding transcriptional regulator/antitoxin component of YhaV-PrlF toxin-antitoxin module